MVKSTYSAILTNLISASIAASGPSSFSLALSVPLQIPTSWATVKSGEGDDAVETVTTHFKTVVENASGLLMPTTGGIGTTIFYIAGVLLIAGAAVLLVLKKRSERAED